MTIIISIPISDEEMEPLKGKSLTLVHLANKC